jgi:hypothetical protein
MRDFKYKKWLTTSGTSTDTCPENFGAKVDNIFVAQKELIAKTKNGR